MFFFLLGVLLLIISEKWYLPFIRWYAETVHCHTPLGFSGVSVMWHSLFVGLPLLCAFIIGVFSVPVGYKGFTQHQFPPKGMRVYKPTKILRGWKGKVKSLFHLLLPSVFIVFAVWGYFQVDNMPQDVSEHVDYGVCQNS